MIKAITFDLDGVYFASGKFAFIKALQGYGVSPAEAQRVFLASDKMNLHYKTGKLSDEEFWAWAMAEWRLRLTQKELESLLVDGYEIDSRVVATVKSARQRGYQTLICSNNFPSRVNLLQSRFGFLDNFDTAVFSYNIGATKPSADIFTALIESSGAAAESIAFADDKAANVTAAQIMGINAFLYKDFDDFIERLRLLDVEL